MCLLISFPEFEIFESHLMFMLWTVTYKIGSGRSSSNIDCCVTLEQFNLALNQGKVILILELLRELTAKCIHESFGVMSGPQ